MSRPIPLSIGKYRPLRRLGSGGFAEVYAAQDIVEGIEVALKVPHPHYQDPQTQEDFRKEIRLTASLDHPNILPIKNAEFFEGKLVVAYPLGEQTLSDRLRRRMALDTCLDFAEQMLRGLAHAHSRRIIHCDVKPENLILFAHGRLRLCDFGIAKVAHRTQDASGSGTVGYVAPEQAMGRPSFRSDVFSAALVIWRMLTGVLPEWPYQWPLAGHDRLRHKVPDSMRSLLRRALQVDHTKRYADAGKMLEAFQRLLPQVRRYAAGQRRRRRRNRTGARQAPAWRELRAREFLRRYRAPLELSCSCKRCGGPVSEAMRACPWCGARRARHREKTRFPARCPRCGRGRKLDWRFCAWCYGAGFSEVSERAYTDRRYERRCSNPRCSRRELLPFSRYCPWCRTKVRRAWPVPGSRHRCGGCGWGVAPEYWEFCPWCGKAAPRDNKGRR